MTLPEESDRAVAQTRAFLIRLASPYVEDGVKGIRREVRAEALRLLRHYPHACCGYRLAFVAMPRALGTNRDNVGKELAHANEIERLRRGHQAALTDVERAAVERAIETLDGYQTKGGWHSAIDDDAATLRGLLERLGGGK